MADPDMASAPPKPMLEIDFTPAPDLHPLYPTTAQLIPELSSNSALSQAQKTELITHCLIRACVFGDLNFLSFLLTDDNTKPYVNLGIQDEDGMGLVSITILGFGAESDRDVEREECVRLLIAQGFDIEATDKAGWTPLHHAALLAPPTLVTFLMTHGCSLFAITRRELTPLDIVTAHSVVPGREDVALLLEEAMRTEGWTGGKMEERRKTMDEMTRRKGKQRSIQNRISDILGIDRRWWGNHDTDADLSEDEEDEEVSDDVYTPPLDYTSMLVFSPSALPNILQSVVLNYPMSIGNCEPANVLYMLARFACLTCDHTWLEDLIIGGTDAIEDSVFAQADDITALVFWLYNTTVWLHLMRCDQSINEACEMLGSFEIIEELINSIFVFIIRFAERKIDILLDATLLEHNPLPSEFDSVQFESEWSLWRSFGGKKKNANGKRSDSARTSTISSASRPPSPPATGSSTRTFASFTQNFSRHRQRTPLQTLFQEVSANPSPDDIICFLTALQTLLTLSGINPAFTTQLWSQIMYWTACESFNRILTRKKYLCRSRAIQISMNLSLLEEWITHMGLPRGIDSHFAPVRDLLGWLQCLSSITDFANLVATIQTMKNLNPLQMRRAVRDYRYEVNEGRMTEECSQYLAQLQKDWERHRVKLGVEALRKEMDDRDRDIDESDSGRFDPSPSPGARPVSTSTTASDTPAVQKSIDSLFDRRNDKSAWEPAKPPQVLGELLDSRYMLPVLLPSDPRMLAAVPAKRPLTDDAKRESIQTDGGRSSRASSTRGAMAWRAKSLELRDVRPDVLKWVDGFRSAARWTRRREPEEEEEEEEEEEGSERMEEYAAEEDGDQEEQRDGFENGIASPPPHVPQFTRKPSGRRGRVGAGGDITPIDLEGDES